MLVGIACIGFFAVGIFIGYHGYLSIIKREDRKRRSDDLTQGTQVEVVSRVLVDIALRYERETARNVAEARKRAYADAHNEALQKIISDRELKRKAEEAGVVGPREEGVSFEEATANIFQGDETLQAEAKLQKKLREDSRG